MPKVAVRVSVTNGDGIVAETIELTEKEITDEIIASKTRLMGTNPWGQLVSAISEDLERALARAYDMD